MPFHLKGTLGRSHRADLNDALRAKQALHELGYFKTPRWGITEYPDEPLFTAIEDFQRDNGLYRDGIMQPDGETATRLGQALVELQQRHAESVSDEASPAQPHGRAVQILTAPSAFGLRGDVGEGRANDPTDVLATERALAWAGYAQGDLAEAMRRFQADRGLEVDGWMGPNGPTARALDEAIAPKLINRREQHPEEFETAAGGALLRLAPPILKDGVKRLLPPLLLEELRRQSGPGSAAPDPGNPREITHPSPPVSPVEPPELEPEEIRPVEQEIPIYKGRPITEVMKTDPAVFAMVSDEFRKSLEEALKASPGDAKTQEGNKRTIQICQEEIAKWGPGLTFEHIGGYKTLSDLPGPDGKPMKETYVPHPKTGRLGSSNADITWRIENPNPDKEGEMHELRVLLNTGRTLKDGRTPIASEQRQLDRMKSNLEANENTMKDQVSFIPKLRPGMDEAEWEERVRQGCREMFEKVFKSHQQ